MQVRAEVGEEHFPPPTPAVTQNGRAQRQLHAATSTELRLFLRGKTDPSSREDGARLAVTQPCPHLGAGVARRAGQGRSGGAVPEPGGGGTRRPRTGWGGRTRHAVVGGGCGVAPRAGPHPGKGPGHRPQAGAGAAPAQPRAPVGTAASPPLPPLRPGMAASPSASPSLSPSLPVPLPHLSPQTLGQAGETNPLAPLPPGRAPGPPRSPQSRPAAAHGSARPHALAIGGAAALRPPWPTRTSITQRSDGWPHLLCCRGASWEL